MMPRAVMRWSPVVRASQHQHRGQDCSHDDLHVGAVPSSVQCTTEAQASICWNPLGAAAQCRPETAPEGPPAAIEDRNSVVQCPEPCSPPPRPPGPSELQHRHGRGADAPRHAEPGPLVAAAAMTFEVGPGPAGRSKTPGASSCGWPGPGLHRPPRRGFATPGAGRWSRGPGGRPSGP